VWASKFGCAKYRGNIGHLAGEILDEAWVKSRNKGLGGVAQAMGEVQKVKKQVLNRWAGSDFLDFGSFQNGNAVATNRSGFSVANLLPTLGSFMFVLVRL
jgi:hypothetical protein